MLRLRSVCRWGVLVVAAGLTMAAGPAFTRQDRVDQDRATQQAPNQAWAHPEHHPTYTDTSEDQMMRVLTDDGAHDRIDMQQ